ncbi:DUF11 domain-containing protein [Paenibacillus sp. S150]|uniref:DUF11 domain-containing protein n=1 Tax=Paenibacillus sp. S150 TaxID=2749826 RepID=UPI001C569C70|nr:DUF11 domain-containing protein [Paenibacillus sp. S150]MBW4083829.1 DUF11 domain-containing protein [Paenibacillus sp. S150]
MSPSARLQPVVTNQSMVLFSSAAGTDSIAYSNTVNTRIVGPVLSLLKNADQTIASLGDSLVYTLAARNEGNVPAVAAVVDALPPGAAFIANSVLRDGVPLPGVSPASGIPLGTLSPQTEVRIAFQVIVVTLPPSLELSNRARAAYSFATPDGRQVEGEIFSNQVTVSLRSHQLSILLDASTPTSFIGDAVTYTLRLRNEGTRLLARMLATIPVPEGTVFIPGSVIANGVYSPNADPDIGINLAAMDPGTSSELSYQVRVASMPGSSVLTAQAVVSYGIDDDMNRTESNIVTIAVVQSGLSVSLNVDRFNAVPGENLRYELTVRNSGELAVDALLADALPPGTLFVWDSVNVNGNAQKGVRPGEGIPLGTLRAESASVVDFLVSIPAEFNFLQLPAIQNQGSVQYTYALPDGRIVRQMEPSNTVVTQVFSPVISIEITGEPPIVEPGGLAEFNIAVTNSGNWPAEVSVIQLVPAGSTMETGNVTISALTAPEPPYSGMAQMGMMHPGQTAQMGYTVRIDQGYIGLALQGFMTALYLYTMDGRSYSGEAHSNSYKLIIEEISE